MGRLFGRNFDPHIYDKYVDDINDLHADMTWALQHRQDRPTEAAEIKHCLCEIYDQMIADEEWEAENASA